MKTNLLERKMNEQGISKAELAKYLKLSEKRLTEKMDGICVWNTWEVMRICMIVQLQDEAEKSEIFLSKSSQKWDKKGENVEKKPVLDVGDE